MRRLVATIATLPLLLGFVASPVEDVTGDNPWLERRVLHIAHQGGETEAPSNTLFALDTALEKGADVLEIDVHATADRELVVIHDTTVDRTTDGSGRIDRTDLATLKQLDAAHWFVPGCGACHERPEDDYVYRGYATGDRTIPDELGDVEPNGFRVPTLREVLERFPDTMINIEIKRTVPDTTPYEDLLAGLLAEFDRDDDTIVVSFYDQAMELFKAQEVRAGVDVSDAPATGQAGAFVATTLEAAPGAPNPRFEALQVPITYEGIPVVTRDFVEDAHANGLAVHVWTIGDPDTMRWLIDIGVDGIMTDVPTVLEQVLADEGVRHGRTVPPGRDVCRERAAERARDRCGGQD